MQKSEKETYTSTSTLGYLFDESKRKFKKFLEENKNFKY